MEEDFIGSFTEIFVRTRKGVSPIFRGYSILFIFIVISIMSNFFSNKSLIFQGQDLKYHRKLTAACQTKANRKKSRGMTGIKSTIGLKNA